MKFKKFGIIAMLAALMASILLCASCANIEDAQKVDITASPSCERANNNAICAHTLFVIAMPEEAKFVVEHYNLNQVRKNLYASNNIACVITGVGGERVCNALAGLNVADDVQIINVGYCGSNVLKIGDVRRVDSVAKNESPKSAKKFDNKGTVACFSADAFVEETDIVKPCVFDMELFYIQKAFPNVVSFKIVSDNLSHSQFEKFGNNKSWHNALRCIDEVIKQKSSKQ